ncbi:MAG: UDP-N-acetylglucosamine pyrophosphorylase [Deltaproteobacteria bacterium]|nr:UDP-N-acetylglucosamine pyrophosphorylase [Deltaproteobacteria bacterium]
MEYRLNEKVELLINKGVNIPEPLSVHIGNDVNCDRISADDVVIYAGCRISGSETLVMKGASLGSEAPVSVEDCQIGPSVELKGGYFKKSVFLEKANMASGAHVRDACILEEEANAAHSVGLKQTILLPFVTLGSLINFCDCLMAGGTSRKNHSEVGSSYIHFNYTPNQDKATPSLIGDVPRGVMLDQRPVFLGGQGGLVGPSQLGFGTVIAAGVVFRGDLPETGQLILGESSAQGVKPFYPGLYLEIRNRTRKNINYIANLIALRTWYENVRSFFPAGDPMGRELLKGAIEKLDMALDERIKRLGALVDKLPQSVEEYTRIMKINAPDDLIRQKKELIGVWNEVGDILSSQRIQKNDDSAGASFQGIIIQAQKENSGDYISVIQGLSPQNRALGIEWLGSIVDHVNNAVLEKLPLFR